MSSSTAWCHLVDVLVPAGERHETGHQCQDPDPAHHQLDHADIAPDGGTRGKGLFTYYVSMNNQWSLFKKMTYDDWEGLRGIRKNYV